MATSSIDWATIIELPPFTNQLFTGINPLFKAILLPFNNNNNPTILRKIQITCQSCPINSTKQFINIKNQYNYKQTSNYWQHLKFKHNNKYKQLRATTISDSDDNTSQSSNTLVTTSSNINNQSLFFRQPNTVINIPDNLKRVIIQFIIINNLSFNAIISPEFRNIIRSLNPQSAVPSEKGIIRDINDYYNERLNNLQHNILIHQTKGYSFNICLDGWTSITQKAFLGITIHWLNNNWKLESYLLRLCPLNKRHSGKYLFKVLLKTLKDFNIDKNILTITCDNASSNIVLVDYFKQYNQDTQPVGFFLKEIRCLAHIINLIVQDILIGLKADITQEDYINISRISEDLATNNDPLIEELPTRLNKRNRYSTNNNLNSNIPIDPTILQQPELVPDYSLNLFSSDSINNDINSLRETEIRLSTKSTINKVRLQISKIRNQQKLIISLKRVILADESLQTNITRPILDTPTRWNSTEKMLETYLLLKPAIDYVINKHQEEFKNILITEDEIILIQELITILKPFKYASTEIQKDKYPVFMLSHLIITQLRQHIISSIDTIQNDYLKLGLKRGLAKLIKYFPTSNNHDLNKYDIYGFSIILDPRFKIDFLSKKLGYTANNIQFIKQRFKKLFDIYSSRYNEYNTNTTINSNIINSEEDSQETYQSQLLAQFTDDLSDNEGLFYDTEFELYLAEARVNKDTNIIDYWKLKKTEFPVLAFIARDFLSIMATSAPIEREFSKLSDITNNKKRNRLSNKRINQLICLRSWANITEEKENLESSESSESDKEISDEE